MGKFIVFEGMDRSGKSTNLDFAYDYLIQKGFSVLKLREPGGVEVSEKLREIILNPSYVIKPRTELLLFLASRNQFVEEKVLPSLQEYDFVLCDRFSFSTIAYQGYGRGINVDEILKMDEFARNGFEADLVVYFDITMDTFHLRARESVDRMEKEKDDFFKKVLDGYKILAEKEKKCYIVNSNNKLEIVTEEVKKILDSFVIS